MVKEIKCEGLLSFFNQNTILFCPKFEIIFNKQLFLYEPRHEISNNVVFATSKGSDQPAHMRTLIRAFVSRLNIL